jgi:hypothetical protein
MRVGDKVMWRRKISPTEVTILWLPTTPGPHYYEPMALIDDNGEPKLVPVRVIAPAPGPCRANVTLNLSAEPISCRHLEGHVGVHEATVGIDPLIYLSWRL